MLVKSMERMENKMVKGIPLNLDVIVHVLIYHVHDDTSIDICMKMVLCLTRLLGIIRKERRMLLDGIKRGI